MAMDSYLDIELRPDPETAPNQLLGALYAKAHLALVAQHGTNVAVCFPGHQMQPPPWAHGCACWAARPRCKR